MNAPVIRMTREELSALLLIHIAASYVVSGGRRGMECIDCSAVIKQATGFVTCNGNGNGGQVVLLPMPFCPSCEGAPIQTDTRVSRWKTSD